MALAARRAAPWNRLAGIVEEAGSALAVLDDLDSAAPDQLFPIDNGEFTLDQLDERIHAWEHEGMTVVTVLDESYPVNLRMVHDRPAFLFLRGALDEHDSRSVAVVGTRKASAAGLEAAREVAQELASAGYVVVSGLAAGIDTAAHTATLDAGENDCRCRHWSWAMLSQRRTQSYKSASHGKLRCSRNLVGQEARKWTFPQRNAVMSGFARTTVVVEASHTSGARMQARLALEHGRPVFLLHSLMEHQWALRYTDYDGVYVVSDGNEIVSHLERLYQTSSCCTSEHRALDSPHAAATAHC